MDGEPRGTNFVACTGEYVDAYTPGGFHPLLIDDELNDGRYKIVHKLGHGGSATVWLAQDIHQRRYVAIKVLQASFSTYAKEVGIHRYLSKDPDFACASIAKIRSHFTIRGINGRHVCLVLDIHGPSLGDLGRTKFRPDHARDITRQIAKAINFLHRNDVAFGDLCPSNILLDCVDFSNLSAEALYETLGRPVPEEVMCVAKDKSVARHAPRWIYSAVDFARRDLNLLKPRIVLADLNEAEHITSETVRSGTGYHAGYASPEFVFGINRRHTKAGDIWALAFIFFEIRCQDVLSYGVQGPEKGSSIQRLIGLPPPAFCDKARAGKKLKGTSELSCITEEELTNSEDTIKYRLQAIGDWEPWHTMTRDERRAYIKSYLSNSPGSTVSDIESKLDTGAPPPARLSAEEITDFHDLLSKMLVWNPEERLTIDQVLEHPWLHQTYNDLDEPSEHWIERYATGQTDWEMCNYDTEYWDSLIGGDFRGNPCPTHLRGEIYGYDEEGNPIDPFAQDPKALSKVVGQADDSRDNDEYFITRLLGLPIPTQEKVEDYQVIEELGSKSLQEDSERSDDVDEKDAHFVTCLLGLPVPTSGNMKEVEVITTHDWGSSMDAIDTYEGSDDNDEFFVTRLLGLPVPQHRSPQQRNVENIEATATQVSKALLEIVGDPNATVENDEYFVTRLLGLPLPKKEHMTEVEVIATD